MSKGPKLISKTVWILSLVSLFADFASEMLYPVVPVYLKDIGFSVALIGILEGVAEFVVGLSKGYFGKRSDMSGSRLPFVKLGYFLSAISKPMMAIFTFPIWIFGARTIDRLGKGIRTAARDALLTGASTTATRARVFNFHRSWDTVGAILGPVTALTYLLFFPGQYKSMFFLALLPGLVSVALIFTLQEGKATPAINSKPGFFGYFSFWIEGGNDFRSLVTGLLLFALANSSDAFLLLKAKSITGSDTLTIAAYIFYNIVYAASAYPLGMLADRWGYKKTLLSGITVFIVVYLGFAVNKSDTGVFLLFGIYGIYAAATEGIIKAWISNLVPLNKTATAIGFYTSCQSICTLLASTIAGIIWSGAGPVYTFLLAAALALAALLRIAFTRFRPFMDNH
ncbi:MFS transporter [Flavihumibacter profundi]|uniref:MFS transporter n=1 Tax=Flavihumibacter profundi TaxID=2716883 RepID=UPI001CC65C22|nr:MFS transporter [Flavihumibacter profundi]MBZ5858080.1 MFS transporter [Flavihumibacter profundi]